PGGTSAAERVAGSGPRRLASGLVPAPDGPRRSRAGRGDLRQHPASRGGRGQAARCLELLRNAGSAIRVDFAETASGVDRGAEVEALVLRLLDEHDRLERLDVVDPLLLALRRDLRLVRPVIELHLGDACDLADLAEIELDLA